MVIDDFPDLVKGFVSRDRLSSRDNSLDIEHIFCEGCHRIANLRECWGCHKWFCYDCLIEHMLGCKEWQKIKGDYDILFECDKHETCDDCSYRFKCYTTKKVPRKKK